MKVQWDGNNCSTSKPRVRLVRQKRRSTTAITDVFIGRRFRVRDKERAEYYHQKFLGAPLVRNGYYRNVGSETVEFQFKLYE